MSALVSILLSLLKVFLPAATKAAQDTAEDAATDTVAAEKLRDKIRSSWSNETLKDTMPGMGLIVLCFLLTGCFTRTIYVPAGTPVRLRAPISDAKVWVLDRNGKPVKGKIDLPEGWFCLPMPEKELKK